VLFCNIREIPIYRFRDRDPSDIFGFCEFQDGNGEIESEELIALMKDVLEREGAVRNKLFSQSIQSERKPAPLVVFSL
jgi:hypothetical protein